MKSLEQQLGAIKSAIKFDCGILYKLLCMRLVFITMKRIQIQNVTQSEPRLYLGPTVIYFV
jgi:hypothetical protein